MLAKYKIEYSIPFHNHEQAHQYLTNDPVACEEALTKILEHGFKVKTILHEGIELPRHEFDRLIKTAAGILASNQICKSLAIDKAEANHRFGVPA